MSESTIRAAIKDVLNTVENIGVVHDYERHAADWGKFLELFRASDGKIRGWEITRVGFQEAQKTMGIGFRPTEVKHHYRIRGYCGLQDLAASEKTVQALVEAIATAFRASPRVGGANTSHEFIQGKTLEPRMFGGVLCHFCELSLTVTEPL